MNTTIIKCSRSGPMQCSSRTRNLMGRRVRGGVRQVLNTTIGCRRSAASRDPCNAAAERAT